MKILIYSRAFWPSIGGLEGIMELLADGFVRAGHRVVVATITPSSVERETRFETVRDPSPVALWRLARSSDVCLCASISLRGLPSLLLSGKPVVVTHHKWYRGVETTAVAAYMKDAVSYLVRNIFVSKAVADRVPATGVVIPNGYEPAWFHEYPDVARTEDLIFVGRLVSEKGADNLVRAVALLAKEGSHPQLTIVGTGPEEPALRELVVQSGLETQVRFHGKLTGEPLGREIARHRVMVVPSSYEEPFGIVALEGIACGCIVVGTDGGGLLEAIGPCGLLARRGDIADLARQIRRALEDDAGHLAMHAAAAAHLQVHRPDHVVTEYLRVLATAAGRNKAPATIAMRQ